MFVSRCHWEVADDVNLFCSVVLYLNNSPVLDGTFKISHSAKRSLPHPRRIRVHPKNAQGVIWVAGNTWQTWRWVLRRMGRDVLTRRMHSARDTEESQCPYQSPRHTHGVPRRPGSSSGARSHQWPNPPSHPALGEIPQPHVSVSWHQEYKGTEQLAPSI